MKFHWLYQRDAWRLCAVDLGGWLCTVMWSSLNNEWEITTRLGDGTVRTSYCYGTADDAKVCAVRRARDLRALDLADEVMP